MTAATATPVELAVVLVSYNTRELLTPCLQALRLALQGMASWRIVVVDNASRDGSADFLAEHHQEVQLIRLSRNVGFGRANNVAVRGLQATHVLLLNIDAFVAPDAITQALAYMAAHPRCGIVGAHLTGRDGALQPSCRYFPTPLNQFLQRTGLHRLLPGVRLVDDMAWAHDHPRACDWVPGCFYLVRGTVVAQVGLFDERFFLYYEEVDHCRMVKQAGWDVVFLPAARVVHLGGESAKSDGPLTSAGGQAEALEIESGLLYMRKHHGRAGLAAHLALEALGALVLTAKAALRTRWGALGALRWRLGKQWQLLAATGAGLRPTR